MRWYIELRGRARLGAVAVGRAPAIALIVLLARCTVGPDYSPPQAPGVQSYTGATEAQPSAAGEGEVEQHLALGRHIAANWWALFRSDELDKMLQEAIAHNRTLAAARATLAQAREAVNQATGAYYPQVTLNASASRQRTNLAAQGFSSAPAEFNLYSVGPSVSYLLDPFGGNRRRVEQQEALAEAQKYQMEAAYLTLTANVVTQVVNIADTRAQISAVGEIIRDDERTLDAVRAETRAGELTRVDVASATSQLASDRALVPPLQQQLSLATDALALLLGKPPADSHPPEFELAGLVLPDELPLSVPSELVHQRPDVLNAEAQLHAANAAIGVATAQLYPNITLSASMAQEALNPGHLFLPMSSIWSLLAGLTAPIFEGGALEAQRRGTERGFEAAVATYEQTVLQSFVQVADVLHALAHDADLLRDQHRAFDAAQASADLTRKTFSYGNISLLQVLDAERQLAQARLGLVRAQAQRYRDTVQLFAAMGGGATEWREAEAGQRAPRLRNVSAQAPSR